MRFQESWTARTPLRAAARRVRETLQQTSMRPFVSTQLECIGRFEPTGQQTKSSEAMWEPTPRRSSFSQESPALMIECCVTAKRGGRPLKDPAAA
jgi:hypothetical protein